MSFSATADGPVEQYASLASTFSVDGDRLDLSGWADLLPDEWPAPETGQGSIRINGALRGPALMQLSAQVELNNVAAAPAPGQLALPAAEPMRQPPGESDEEHREQLEADEVDRDAAAGSFGPHRQQMVSYDRVAFALQRQAASMRNGAPR